MSANMTTAFNMETTGLVELLLQQKGSILRQHIVTKSMQGRDSTVINQLGKVTATEKTSFAPETTYGNIQYFVRHCHPKSFDHAELIDRTYNLQTLVEPTNEYIMAIAYAIGRKVDDEIIRAALQPAMTGRDGTTAVALPAAQKIAHGNSGLTLAKLEEVNYKFSKADVDLDREEVRMFIDPQQTRDLLNVLEVKSADYNQVQPLMSGKVVYFMGIKFIPTNRLTKAGRIRSCAAFVSGGIVLGDWEDLYLSVNTETTRSHAKSIYGEKTYGATRTQEEKVIEIACQEPA
jgi:hypothetical protein